MKFVNKERITEIIEVVANSAIRGRYYFFFYFRCEYFFDKYRLSSMLLFEFVCAFIVSSYAFVYNGLCVYGAKIKLVNKERITEIIEVVANSAIRGRYYFFFYFRCEYFFDKYRLSSMLLFEFVCAFIVSSYAFVYNGLCVDGAKIKIVNLIIRLFF